MGNLLRPLFLLDPDVVFLNHGSFGATPKPVFDTYQEWQRRLERQPVQFIINQLPGYLQDARRALGELINADADDLAYIPNATFGVNIVARSLKLGPEDQVLTTNQEYGACENAWLFMQRQQGFDYIQQPIPNPVGSAEEILESFWQGVTERTKVIFISHITSPTALVLPVEAICARAREAGILTVVDGAHTLGQIELDLAAVGADFYTANAHKWLCAPKGSAFLHSRPEVQHLIEPLVVSWGWGKYQSLFFGSEYVDKLQYLGTNDLSAYLSVPAAIAFQKKYDWPSVRQQCHQLLTEALARMADLTGQATFYPANSGFYHQVAVAPLPQIADLTAFKAALYDRYRVEIPVTTLGEQQFLRISIQGYNDRSDIDALLSAVAALLPAFKAA